MWAFLIQTTKFNYIATTGLYVYLNTKCSWFSFKSSSSFTVSKLLQSTKSFLSFKANFNCNLFQCKTQVTYLQYTMAQIIHYHSKMKKNVNIMRKYRMKGKSKLSRAIFNFSSPCHIDDFIFPAFLAAKNSFLLVFVQYLIYFSPWKTSDGSATPTFWVLQHNQQLHFHSLMK